MQEFSTWQEPQITINGTTLTVGQSIAVRVAISSFILEMKNNGLGDYQHGEEMAKLYLARAGEVQEMMLK
jgi:hypothetical protein